MQRNGSDTLAGDHSIATDTGSVDVPTSMTLRQSVTRARLLVAGTRWLDFLATVMMIIAATMVIWSTIGQRSSARSPARRPSVSVPTEPVSIDGSQFVGNRAAKVVIVAFSEFQCPFCQRFVKETWPQLKAAFIDTGIAQYVFRHNPLTGVHPRALGAAEAAECAGRQSKFWSFHDQLFGGAPALEDSDFGRYASATGLDLEAFRACIEERNSPQVNNDMAAAKALGIRGTPTFLLGLLQRDRRVRISEVLTGTRTAAEFAASLNTLARAANR